jgi:peptidoglycan/LPS O-acetylase OafA/YrhL
LDFEHRLQCADFMRFAACFVVLFHHLVQSMGYSTSFGYFGWLAPFFIIGGLGVGMFFVLSGFLLARPFWQAIDAGKPMPSLKVYFIRRAVRILPGFWLAMTTTFIISIYAFHRTFDGELLMRYVAGMLLISDWHWTTLFPVEINGPLWSIGFEATSYVLLPIGFVMIFHFARSTKSYWVLWTLWLVTIAITLGCHWLFMNYIQVPSFGAGWKYGLQGGAKLWMPRINPFAMFAIFAIGALAAGLQVRIARHRSWAFDLLSLIALAFIAFNFWRVWQVGEVEAYAFLHVPYAYPILPFALGAFLVLTPSSLIVSTLLDNPLIAYLARISFGIYVWHYLVIALVSVYVLPRNISGHPDEYEFIIGTFTVIAISMIIATLSYKYMEEPIIRWARQRE